MLSVKTEAAKRGLQLKDRRQYRVLRNTLHFWAEMNRIAQQADTDGSSIASSQIEDNHHLASHTSALWKAGELRDRCVRARHTRLMSDSILEWASILNHGADIPLTEDEHQDVPGVAGGRHVEVNHQLATHTSAAFKAADLRERCLRSQTVSRKRRAIVAWEEGIEVQHEEKRSQELESQRQAHDSLR